MADLDKKEHKNWVLVGCALNIAKNGISPKIQKEMEAWYRNLISSPPLQSLSPCTCPSRAAKCTSCTTWEAELSRHHMAPRPKICWNNSDKNQWGSPAGAWEIAKLFMPTLGTRKMDVVDAETTDIGGLLNLMEWCPFLTPPVNKTVLCAARDECRNHWAHSPKQEIQDVDVPTIFSHLNNLLSDPVFNADKEAQKASQHLQDLFHQGLVNVRDSEMEALHLLRQSLASDLTKCQDDLTDVQTKVAQVDAETKKLYMAAHKDLSEVEEIAGVNKDDIGTLKAQVEKLRVDIQSDLSEVKEQGDLNNEDLGKLREELETQLRDAEAYLSTEISTVLRSVDDFNTVLNQRDDLQEDLNVLHDDVEIVRNRMVNVASDLNLIQSKVLNFETNLAIVKSAVQKVTIKMNTTETKISGLQKDFMDVKEVVDSLKENGFQAETGDDEDIFCTAPSRLPSFTGRTTALSWLEKNLVLESSVQSGAKTSCCTKTICGLGGCGKTSLAVEFAWINKSRFPGGVFWINGESDDNIHKSVAEILALKNIFTPKSANMDETLTRFLTWLSNKELPWLLVVDNVDELQDPTCPTGVKKICKGPWQRNSKSPKRGHILLTTRQNARDARAFLKNSCEDYLELQCFSEDEGVLFLMKRKGLEGKSLEPDAVALTKELGALPLALEQAAAYITASPIPLSFADYLKKYREVKLRLLKQQPATALSMEAQHRLSVHTTWEMNFAYVKEQSPAAASMMRIAAFLESENVPFAVINPGLPELDQDALKEKACCNIEIAMLLRVLSSYSLFSVSSQNRVFHVHKLIQEVVRDSLTVTQKLETLVAASRLLNFALQNCSKSSKSRSAAGYLSELKDEERRIAIALLLNFRKLKNHIEDEIDSHEEKFAPFLCNDDSIIDLFTFVGILIESDVFFFTLRKELWDVSLKVRKVRGSPDPNILLTMMTCAAISKRNVPGRESHDEAKRLAQETVHKMAEFEKSGFVIEDGVKYHVLEHIASYYASEGKWKENYEALLELEGLSLSDENVVNLQIMIGRAENFISAGNFECVLKRHLRALELARKIYPSDHHELLRVLQFVTMHFYNDDKLQEARVYAEEMLQIAKKQPPASDYYLRGITSALTVIRCFDPYRAENILCNILVDRWPDLYKDIQSGAVARVISDSKHEVDESSYEHASTVLVNLMTCFNAHLNIGSKLSKQEGHFYRSVAEKLISLRKKMYEDNHPDVAEANYFMEMVHLFLGNQGATFKRLEQLWQCFAKQASNHHFSSRARCDRKVLLARNVKNLANDCFKSGCYSRALNLYNRVLNECPNDAKLLTNRAATYVKLSEQHGLAAEEKRKFLQLACQDANVALTADPSWVKGYYWKAVCLSKLGQRGPSLATAAVARHFFPSQCSGIPAVVEHFGHYSIKVIATVDELLQLVRREAGRNLVILVKEGRYELTESMKVPANAVMVGVGKVQIVCTKDVLLRLDKTVYTENIELSSSVDTIKMLKEKAKESLNRGQLDEALSHYSKALTICPEDAQLLTARALTYLKSAEENRNMNERVSSLELALKDSESSTRADPSWFLGYHTKATSLAELGRKHEALAAAAVFNHLSSGRDISSVIERYGALQIDVVKSSDELRTVLQEITEREELNQIVLLKEGDYLLEKTVEMKQAIVVIGLGKVTVSCKTGVPFQFRKEHFVENVALHSGCGEEPTSHEAMSSRDDSGQEEDISLDLPSGYDNSSANSECKVN